MWASGENVRTVYPPVHTKVQSFSRQPAFYSQPTTNNHHHAYRLDSQSEERKKDYRSNVPLIIKHAIFTFSYSVITDNILSQHPPTFPSLRLSPASQSVITAPPQHSREWGLMTSHAFSLLLPHARYPALAFMQDVGHHWTKFLIGPKTGSTHCSFSFARFHTCIALATYTCICTTVPIEIKNF